MALPRTQAAEAATPPHSARNQQGLPAAAAAALAPAHLAASFLQTLAKYWPCMVLKGRFGPHGGIACGKESVY